MPSYRFVHAADLHLDSPFKGLKRVSPEIAEVLRKSTFDAFAAVIKLCIDEQVDALLVAGDVFDSADRSLGAQLRFVDGLKRLESAGIRSFVCHGNHDPLDTWHSQVSFPDNCCRFGPVVTSSDLRPDDPDSPIVYGYSYPTKEVRVNVVPEFERIVQPGRIAIGLLHANVGADTGHESYAPCTVDDLGKVGIRYWALGHVHTRQEFNLPEGFAVYPGNTQGRHANETGARGVYMVTITENGSIERSFRAVDVVRWEHIAVDISDYEDMDSFEREIDRQIDLALETSDGRHLVYRVHLSGRGPLHSLVNHQEYAEELSKRLNDEWSERSPFAYCDRVTVSTRQDIDRDDLIERDDFIGDLLRFFDQSRDDYSEGEDLLEGLKPLYEHRRLRKYLSVYLPKGTELTNMLDEAESICLDLLVTEESDEN
jgi:DNA repair exonuclease SbcCD nuclease subunit